MSQRTSRQAALAMAQAALDAKAEQVVLLDLRKLSFSFDFFLICTAGSDRRIQTVVEEMREKLSGNGNGKVRQEGKPDGGWMLVDSGSVVGHVFSSEAREFYQLERLWADAPRVRVPAPKKR